MCITATPIGGCSWAEGWHRWVSCSLGGGKPSQAGGIPVETGNVAVTVPGMARGLLRPGIKARPDLSIACSEARTLRGKWARGYGDRA